MKNKSLVVIFLIIVIVMSLTLSVNAAEGDSYKINLLSDKTQLNTGDTLTLNLKISDINILSGDKGIGSYQGKISYDESVFGDIKASGNDNWDAPVINEGNFTSVKTDGICISEDQEIATITLKVKSDAKSGTYTIKVSNFEASNAIENISTDDVQISVTVKNTQSTTTTNTTTNKVTTSTTANKTNTVTTSSKLPYTGKGQILAVFITILAVSGIVSYIKYKRVY